MSVELHGGRYIEAEEDESLDSRLRRFLRGTWAKARGGRAEGRLDDETLALERDLRPRSRFVPILLTLVALNAFATVIWYAYNWGQGSLENSALPVIAGDSDPIKVRPTEEGGLEIPHQDKLVLNGGLEDPENLVVEHLLPPPEVPQELAFSTAKEGGGEIATLGHQLQASKPGPSAPVVVVEAEGVAIPSEPEAAAVPSATVPSAVVPSAPAVTAEQPAAAPEPAPAPAPKQVQTAQVPTDSGFLLQLAAVQDAAAAEKEWARLQKAHPQLLGSLGLTIEKADVGGKTYYRILTGPFPTRVTVEDMCAQLKSQKQSCLVKKQAP